MHNDLRHHHVFTLSVDLADPIEAGPVPAGYRRVIPIVGGTVEGPEVSGEILVGGADWNTVGADGTAHLWARYDFRTTDGTVIGVINEGKLDMAPRSADSEVSQAAAVSIVTFPRFDAPAGAFAWLNSTAFLGLLTSVEQGRVRIAVHRVRATD